MTGSAWMHAAQTLLPQAFTAHIGRRGSEAACFEAHVRSGDSEKDIL